MAGSGIWRRRSGRLIGSAALAGVCLLAAVTAPAHAATDSLYAAPTAAGAADCSSPANACSIADAVTAANAKPIGHDVRIELAGGTYSLSGPSPTALRLTFAGPSLTIEAGSGTPILEGTTGVRQMELAASVNATIDGVAFEHGDAGAAASGGAILANTNSTLTVKRSTFTSNQASAGGAIASVASRLTVQDSTFSANAAINFAGGAIFSIGPSTSRIERSAIIANTAPSDGGGINIQPGATTRIISSTIAGNTSGGAGGGMAVLGSGTVQSSTIANNTATVGDAIAANSRLTLAASIVLGPSPGSGTCTPANGFVDSGYNLDSDGTCVASPSPATGSHSGATAYGSSTYADVLAAYLADAPADNGGRTPTLALLSSPAPFTSLADPAFAVVPSSFAVPITVDGSSTACGVPDQRGVAAVAGVNCDIGAFRLLAPTTTALTASNAVAGQNVTFTATITAPDAGTVSFDDGAGNPATTHCAAQSLSSGTATCTVTYPSAGTYTVTATYSGAVGYSGSRSAPQTLVVAAAPPARSATPDRTRPTSRLRRISSTKQPITLRGTATDASGIRRVRVSVARHVGKRCRFLRADHTFSKARSCKKTSYVDAKGRARWSLKLPRLPYGRYTIWTRSIDTAGNVERKARGRNLRLVRIPRAKH